MFPVSMPSREDDEKTREKASANQTLGKPTEVLLLFDALETLLLPG